YPHITVGRNLSFALECGARVGLPLCAGELATGSPVTSPSNAARASACRYAPASWPPAAR
ncbi:hypothetical protein, partial [Pseudomonas aeruginosa]|uniref:hypothetical protein n=1 Tax=Pseudomonas aeruginosa TaxID=287 RepID=UPI001A9F9874